MAKKKEQPVEVTGDRIGQEYRDRYGPDNHCGDDIAVALTAYTCPYGRGHDPDKLERVAKANKIDTSKYAHLNAGMLRMTIGNLLRGKFKVGLRVKIGSKTFQLEATTA